MLWLNFILVLLPLLTKNVQAAESYFGNRNWNLRRPIAGGVRPDPVVNPTHSIPKPLPAPVEVGSYNPAPEIKEPIPEVKPPEMSENEQPISVPNLRVLPPRGLARRPSLGRTEPPAPVVTEEATIVTEPEVIVTEPPIIVTEPAIIVTEPAVIVTEPETIVTERATIATELPILEETQTTSLPTTPEILPPDDIQVFPTKPPTSNPSYRRPMVMVPRPLPRPARVELPKPKPAAESVIPTTGTPPPLPVIETESELNPEDTIIIDENPTTEAPLVIVLPEGQSTPAAVLEIISEPSYPESGLLKLAPAEEPKELEAVADSTLPEKEEEASQSEPAAVDKEQLNRPGYSVIRRRPVGPARLPVINGRPHRVPRPVVSSPRPTTPRVVVTTPRIVVTPPPAPVRTTTPKVTPKPIGRSDILPPNSESHWSTPAPKELIDYRCAQSEGYFSIKGECDNYVECRKNTAIMYTCPDGLHYNPKARWPEYPCAYPSEVKCESNAVRQISHPTDQCPQQYGFYPIDSECSRYIMCQEGIAFTMNCPPGLVFNSASSSCDWQENVPSCNPDVFHGFTCPAPPLEEDGTPSEFIFKYRYKESCKEYIACQRGHPRLLRCDVGLSFDEESEVCVDSDYVTNCRY